MDKKLMIAVALSAILTAPAVVHGQQINAAGSGGTPLSVGTSTPVQVLGANKQRTGWTIFAESSDLRCMAGDSSGNPPAIAPSATAGFLLKSGQYVVEGGATGGYPRLTAQARLDCIAVTQSTSVDTWEEK